MGQNGLFRLKKTNKKKKKKKKKKKTLNRIKVCAVTTKGFALNHDQKKKKKKNNCDLLLRHAKLKDE